MSIDGWVKNYRKIAEWEWYTTPNMAHLWQHLIREANHRDGRWQGYELKKGQLICGLHTLSAATGITIRGLRTCLTRLEQSGEITRKTTNRFSIITINKYCKYQTEEDDSDKQTTSKRQANDKQTTTNKNLRMKEEKNKNIIARPEIISEKSWNDLLSLRKKTGGAMTERAINSLVSEFEKAVQRGYTVDQCIDEISNRSWRGFKAEWMANSKVKPAGESEWQ